jgi:hypothetical protein
MQGRKRLESETLYDAREDIIGKLDFLRSMEEKGFLFDEIEISRWKQLQAIIDERRLSELRKEVKKYE